MRIYIVKRLLAFIPALGFLAILSFAILKHSPGDPVQLMYSSQNIEFGTDNSINEKTQTLIRHQLGLDLPVFYISLNIENKIFPDVKINPENQFHNWFFGGKKSGGIVTGDFGNSFLSHEPVISIIKKRIGWSLLLSLLSILISFFIAIPIGIKMASNETKASNFRTSILFNILYSLPAFWVAILLLFTFSNPGILNIFPVSGVSPIGGFPNDISFLQRLIKTIPYLILPTITYTYSSFAFISGNIKSNFIGILKQDYIRTARAKGVTEKNVLKKHALPNAAIQLISIFSHVFPFMIGGSVILETVFNIPGMGNTIFQGISSQDYPLVVGIFFLTGLITMFGFLLSDILYAVVDPRIKYTSE